MRAIQVVWLLIASFSSPCFYLTAVEKCCDIQCFYVCVRCANDHSYTGPWGTRLTCHCCAGGLELRTYNKISLSILHFTSILCTHITHTHTTHLQTHCPSRLVKGYSLHVFQHHSLSYSEKLQWRGTTFSSCAVTCGCVWRHASWRDPPAVATDGDSGTNAIIRYSLQWGCVSMFVCVHVCVCMSVCVCVLMSTVCTYSVVANS